MDLPSAQTRIDDTTAPAVQSAKLLCVLAPVPTDASAAPWIAGNPAAVYARHGYASAVDFVALFESETRLPVLFAPCPIVTPGVVGRFDASGNTGSSVVSVAVGASGSLDEVDGAIRVNRGGAVGTDQIVIDISLDGQTSWIEGIRIGTATSYAIPYVGQIVSLAGGALVAGDVALTWHSTAPRGDAAGVAAVFAALKLQQKQIRSVLSIGEVSTAVQAGYLVTAVNDYETSKYRYTAIKAPLRDRLPQAALSRVRNFAAGTFNATFTEVGATGDTIARSAGSFVTDGFASGDTVVVAGAVASAGANNVTGVPATIAAGLLTLGSTDLVNEGPIGGVTIYATPTLTFVDGGAGADSLTLNRGSFLADGIRAGDAITIVGTSSNDGTLTVVTAAATTLTFATASVVAEVIGSYGVTIVAGESDAVCVSALEAEMASISDEKRIDLGYGRGRKQSPFTNAMLRRNVQWADTIRAYQHDVHLATWQKDLGPLSGWSLVDAVGTTVEHDEDNDRSALQAGFTCFRSWPNGPAGAYIARSVTRAQAGTVLSATENMAVANLAQTVTQLAAENAIGRNIPLNADGTADAEALGVIESAVDGALARNLLTEVTAGEGPRASLAKWTPSTDDDLRGVDATLNASETIMLNGKLVRINTIIRVNTGA